MAPGAVRQEPRQGRDQLGWLEQVMLTLCPTLKNKQPSQVVMCHKETLVPVPALFLGRAHTERRQTAIASEWPTSADLGPKGFQGPDNAARFMNFSLIKMDVGYLKGHLIANFTKIILGMRGALEGGLED